MRLGATKSSAISSYNGLGNQLWDLGGARPSLDLNFAGNKNLSDNISTKNLVTFTRASSGTYVGSDGLIKTATTNEARFDHNPTTGESLGLLVEEQRTNLLVRSEELDNASWIKQSNVSVTANQAIAPNGTSTADAITWTSASVDTGIYQQILSTLSPSTPYTRSIWIRADSAGGTVTLADPVLTVGVVTVNLTTTWQRVLLTENSTASGGAGVWIRKKADSPNTIYLWGAQLEAGSFPTSYIPTTTAAVTRSADVASITGSNFSSWYRQDEGTVFTDTVNRETYPGSNVFPYIIQIDDGTNNNRISHDNSVLSSGYRYNLPCNSGGVSQGELNQFGFASGAARWASAFRTNDFALAINLSPSVVSTRTSGTLPNVMTQLKIGAGFGKQFTGTIRRLTYWPQRLPNSTLQQITR